MSARYNNLSIEAILEDPEEEHHQRMLVDKDEDTPSEAARRQSRSWFDRNMGSNKVSTGKEREKRKHRSSTSGKEGTKSKSKSSRRLSSSKHTDVSRPSRQLALIRNGSSTSSSEDDEPNQDHRLVLAAAKARLTSPSMVSTFTALTNTTNKSSGSSGSNSTVTQASITKRSGLGKHPEVAEPPLSPAVPDAPDVFAFLDDSQSILEKDASSESESDSDDDGPNEAQWPPARAQIEYVQSELPPHLSHGQFSGSSSTSSSFHGEDDFSSHHTGNDTDRSTSPESSIKDHDSEHETTPASDPVSVKIASQIAAAQQRQNLSMHPQVQRITTGMPQSPSSAITPRCPQPQNLRPHSPGDGLPVTGYELLANRLSCHNPNMDDGTSIKPMYRKFEALNHRVLLHLQDELSELEEHLQRIDQADTQSRRIDREIVPASRRTAEQLGGELQWHKADVLGKIGYKLAQYNQALSSFNTTQSLTPPDPDDISAYRTYLQTENPIVEAETHFLDPTDDLVSVYSENLRQPPRSHRSASYAASTYSIDARSAPSTFPPSPAPYDLNTPPSILPGLASAIAVSILVPILTFNVIPQFIGRLTVTLLVAVGVVGALLQSGIIHQRALLGRESMTCAGIYGGVMIVMAGII